MMEEAVASIYGTFIRLFPHEKSFWEDLYQDEKKHSSFLIESTACGTFDKMKGIDRGLSMPLLNRTQKYIENVINHIRANPVSLEEALKMALEIEETTVETFTNELISNLGASDSNAFLQMLMEEKTHVAKIKSKMIEKGFLKLF
jgi:rubrerythrin